MTDQEKFVANNRLQRWSMGFVAGFVALGFGFDHDSNRFECADSPFAAKVLPMSSV